MVLGSHGGDASAVALRPKDLERRRERCDEYALGAHPGHLADIGLYAYRIADDSVPFAVDAVHDGAVLLDESLLGELRK